MILIKKILIFIFFLFSVFFLSQNIKAANIKTNEIYVHYFRYGGDYTGWNLWMWQKEPVNSGPSESFAGYQFSTDDTTIDYNWGGVITKITLTGHLEGATTIGLIVRKGAWEKKDVEQDRFIDVPEYSENGIFHIYLVEGDPKMGTSVNDVNGPSRAHKFTKAYFTTTSTIYFAATENLVSNKLSLKADDVDIAISNIELDGKQGTFTISEELDFSKKYIIKTQFSDYTINTYQVTFDGIYSSSQFEEAFAYQGDDLGATVKDDKTTFRLWAPISSQVFLNLYNTGTPLNLGGTNTPIKTVAMTKSEKGTFYYEEETNLHGIYYTYTVVNQSKTSEVVDPYAKSVGINGLRGLVVDFSQTNPDGFSYGLRPNNMVNATDAIIYELHVRDLTSHESWNGSNGNRGKFLGLIEKGTSYEGIKTGFDHIVDLGITHLQLLPFFDFGYLQEEKINSTSYNSFNWGYMPINFNALEGAYSKNPYDGLVRINEMKQVVAAFTEANIRINMDVVYNHHGLTADSNFELIVPGYYFRKNANGDFSNGSGTGNETASERIMMRKFMLDSIKFWITEYNISGFRFDLMALHDIETMTEIVNLAHDIDPTIMIYGEPWTGGTSALPANKQAGKANLYLMNDVGAFNDDFRDAVKGSVFAREQGGFIQGSFTAQNIARVKYGIVGGIEYDGIPSSLLSHTSRHWHTSPLKTINYVTCHDNNTLYDKLYLSLETSNRLKLIPALSKQAGAMVLTSQGIAFIHAGDEFLRSKPLINKKGFDHNSYQSPDEVNQLRWDKKASQEGLNVYNYYKGLIALRKQDSRLRLTTKEDIINNLHFVFQDKEGLIAYTIKDEASPTKPLMLVIHNANSKTQRLKLPKGGAWEVYVNQDQAGLEVLKTYNGGNTIRINPHTTMVLYHNPSIVVKDYSIVLYISITGVVLISLGLTTLYLKKKKLWFFK